jgi:hypothetical protein
MKRQWNSPYINRFLSADTIVPSYANPQSLNRYSYVLNNPLRYTDPTGHKPCEEYAGSCLSEHQVTQKYNTELHKQKKKRDTLDIFNPSNWTDKGYLISWDGEVDIDPSDWDLLLSISRDKAHSTPGIILFYESFSFDTMFYNDHGKLSGRGCINGICYDRSELNYVAQGELWAALGSSNPTGHKIVEAWKEAKCLCNRNDLQEEYDMFDIGYHHYQELYPHHPNTPDETLPGVWPLVLMGPDI